MNKIPTAEELSKKYTRLRSALALKDLSEFAIEFAKLHVEAALEEAKNSLKDGYVTPQDEQDILNAYPLTNIK